MDWEGLNTTWIDKRVIQLETSNICNLACPGCARLKYKITDKNLFSDLNFTPYSKEVLPVNDFKYFLTNTKYISSLFYNLSVSDPIYSPNMFEELDLINSLQIRPKLIFSTNGSGKSVTWWKTFSKKLQKGDVVGLAIDGLEDTNHIYRKNSNWQSIIDAIKVLRDNKNVVLNWRYIVFEHNYHQIREAYIFSKKIGFRNFNLFRYGDRTPDDMKLKSITWDEAVDIFKKAISDCNKYGCENKIGDEGEW